MGLKKIFSDDWKRIRNEFADLKVDFNNLSEKKRHKSNNGSNTFLVILNAIYTITLAIPIFAIGLFALIVLVMVIFI